MNSVTILGSDFPQATSTPPSGGSKAKLSQMIIADPGVAFKLNFELDANFLEHTRSIAISFSLGPSANEMHHHTNIGISTAQNELLDLTQDFVFVIPFIDPAFNIETGNYHYELRVEFFDNSSHIILGPQYWTPFFSGAISSNLVKRTGQFSLTLDGQSPEYINPTNPATGDPVLYSHILFHQLGAAYSVQLPAITEDQVTAAGLHFWVNMDESRICNVALFHAEETHTFNMNQEAGFIWMTYPRTTQGLTLSSAQINVEPFPQDLGVSNLNYIEETVSAVSGAVVISVV